jgi:two-component system LytT family response regulator
MPSRPTIRAILVDDEPPALRRLHSLLGHYEEIEIVGEYSDGTAAIEGIRTDAPQVVFLDIQMPGVDGFQVIQALGRRPPFIVFVTAYDEHAIRAFEAQALDYLLKPVTRERLRTTVERLAARLETESPAEVALRLERVVASLTNTGAPSRVAVQQDGRVLLLDPDDIDWVEVQENYLALHVGRARYLLRSAMSALEERLPSGKFLRIHRARLVNIERVREIQPWFHGDYVLVLADGTRLLSGPTYRERLQELIGAR